MTVLSTYYVFILLLAIYSAVWINLVGLVALISLCCYGGMVIFARYADCEPLTAGVHTTCRQF